MPSKPIMRPLPNVVFLKCRKCGRSGQYPKARYYQISGLSEGSDALRSFAVAVGCELAAKMSTANASWTDYCWITFDIQKELEVYGSISGYIPPHTTSDDEED